MIHTINSGVIALAPRSETGDTMYVVSPVSIPVTDKTIALHIKKNAFIVVKLQSSPLAFDEHGIKEFLAPLFRLQELGSRNNVLLVEESHKMSATDALLAWQLFGGIALPVMSNIQTTLKVIDEMLAIPMKAHDGAKRAMQFITGLPYTELGICDDWSIEQSLVYALVNGNLPHSEKKLFELSELDRNVLLGDLK